MAKNNFEQDRIVLISFFLRLGLAIVFLYASISSFVTPTSWMGFVPLFIRNVIPGNIFLTIFSIYEIILSLWLLSNKKIYYASILSALTILLIIFPNISQLDIIFRDIPIFFSAAALAILNYKK